MALQRFKRVWSVTAYHPKVITTGGYAANHYDFFNVEPNGVEITTLRVQFEVKRDLHKEPNTCDLTLTNLASGERLSLVREPLVVRLSAGWENDGGPKYLFGGDLRYGFSKLEDTDWQTVLELADGGRAVQHARISKSYKAGTPTLTVLRDVARSMGVLLPKNLESAKELKRSFPSGVQLHGESAAQMTKLLQPYGYGWSFQNGRLTVLRDDEPDVGTVPVISVETGMLASPEFGKPEKKGGPPKLTVKMLLKPELSPGSLVSVQSEGIKGIFRIETVKHNGDSHGDDWFTEIEAKQVNAKIK